MRREKENGQSPLQSNLECDEAEKHGVTDSDLIEFTGFDSGARPLPAIRGVEPPSTNRPEALIISRFPQEIPVDPNPFPQKRKAQTNGGLGDTEVYGFVRMRSLRSPWEFSNQIHLPGQQSGNHDRERHHRRPRSRASLFAGRAATCCRYCRRTICSSYGSRL